MSPNLKFLGDVMLARPARWLRMFGYDTIIAKEPQTDDELLIIAKDEARVIITRDKLLITRAKARKVEAIYVEARTANEQLEEIVKTLNLEINFPQQTRCSQCNGQLVVTSREEVKTLVPEKVQSNEFWQCPSCGKVYWKGSHWDRIMKVIKDLKSK